MKSAVASRRRAGESIRLVVTRLFGNRSGNQRSSCAVDCRNATEAIEWIGRRLKVSKLSDQTDCTSPKFRVASDDRTFGAPAANPILMRMLLLDLFRKLRGEQNGNVASKDRMKSEANARVRIAATDS